jgi:hypothetical protein
LFVGTLRDRPGVALFVAFGLALLFTMGALVAFLIEMLLASRGLRDQADRADEVGETRPRPTEAGEPHRSARSLSTADAEGLGANSILLEGVVDPAVRKRAETLLPNLDSIIVEQICETAEKSQVVDDENAARAFAI